MRHLRSLALAATLAVVLPSCAPVEPGEIAASEEALSVCHTTVVEGIDVSEFQGGSIDWTMVHNSGRAFAIARIADGGHTDPDFATNYAGIQAAGMVRGAYLFWRPQISALNQAQTIINAVGTLGAGDLPPTLDIECMCPYHSARDSHGNVAGCESDSYSDCVSPATAATMITDLHDMLAAHYGRPPMIYTGTWFWDGGTYLAGALQLPDSPLWVSGYVSGCVSVPSGWTDWQIWQYSDGAGQPAVPGSSVGSGGDRNRWNGDAASLMAFTGGGSTTPIYGGHYVTQSFPLSSVGTLQIQQGASAAASITMRNSGTADWDGSTRLATTVARDRTDMFVGSDWVAPNRLASVPAGTTIPPGEMYTFAWTFTVPPGTPVGMYDEHFGLVEDGVAWFGDPGQGGPSDGTIEVIIEVTEGPDSGTPPANDAAVVTPDAGMMAMGDASHVGSDASSMSTADAGGVVMGRALSGGCGCTAAGGARGEGAWLIALALGLLVLRRRAKLRA